MFIIRFHTTMEKGLVCLWLITIFLAMPQYGQEHPEHREGYPNLREALTKQRLEILTSIEESRSNRSDLPSLELDIKQYIKETILQLESSLEGEELYLRQSQCRTLLQAYYDVVEMSLVNFYSSGTKRDLPEISEYLIGIISRINNAGVSLTEDGRQNILHPAVAELRQLQYKLAESGDEKEALHCIISIKSHYTEQAILQPIRQNESQVFSFTLAESLFKNDYDTFLKEARELFAQYQDRSWAFLEAFLFGNDYPRFRTRKYDYLVTLSEVYKDHPNNSILANLYSKLAINAGLLGFKTQEDQWWRELLKCAPAHGLAEVARQSLKLSQKKADDLPLSKAGAIPKDDISLENATE